MSEKPMGVKHEIHAKCSMGKGNGRLYIVPGTCKLMENIVVCTMLGAAPVDLGMLSADLMMQYVFYLVISNEKRI